MDDKYFGEKLSDLQIHFGILGPLESGNKINAYTVSLKVDPCLTTFLMILNVLLLMAQRKQPQQNLVEALRRLHPATFQVYILFP